MTEHVSSAVVTVPARDGRHTLRRMLIPQSDPIERDLLVRVEALSINPVDAKLAARLTGERILGFDATGTVVAHGPDASRFRTGDRVWFCGTPARPGSMQSVQRIDERLVGRAPVSVGAADAAALPLTALTAWETLFDKLRLSHKSTGTLLVVGGAGGVGSAVLALAAAMLPGVRVIATASRPESAAWVARLGAADVVDHDESLVERIMALVPAGVDWIISTASEGRIADYARILVPRGEIVGLDRGPVDVTPLKEISGTWHWEFVFTRADPARFGDAQGQILDALADLVDDGRVPSTRTTTLGDLSPALVSAAYQRIAQGHTIGKTVLTVP